MKKDTIEQTVFRYRVFKQFPTEEEREKWGDEWMLYFSSMSKKACKEIAKDLVKPFNGRVLWNVKVVDAKKTETFIEELFHA
tara:strand:- start:3402 stop:3647 length:246 start_codon:yes stop_codon:yes gene_type:complete